MHDTVGFPLAFSIGECRSRGWAPDIPGFIVDAVAAGWDFEKARDVVIDAVQEVDGSEAAKLVSKGIAVYARVKIEESVWDK